MSYRTPSAAPAGVPDPHQVKCPVCGVSAKYDADIRKDTVHLDGRNEKSPIPNPRACSPTRRVRLGLFHRCTEEGVHRHERCLRCGHNWVEMVSN